MDTKWKKWKGAVSFTAFFLGVNLFLAGAFFLALIPLGGYTVRDAIEPDYQNTQAFRDLVAGDLDALIALAGGEEKVSLPLRDGNSYMDASLAVDMLTPDKNLLFSVTGPNSGTYANGNPGGRYAAAPTGYTFYLSYDGQKVSIQKDGQELDVYGDGYYYGGDQWRVPGYSNRGTHPGVKISMAVAQTPVAYDLSLGQSPLYWLTLDLHVARVRLIAGAAMAAAGLALLVLCVVWRKERAETRRAIAVRTGKVWFEVKLLALVPLAFAALIVVSGFSYRLRDMMFLVYRFARNDGGNLEVAIMAGVSFYAVWLLYFLINELRCHGAPWRTGLVASCVRANAGEGSPKTSALNAKLAGWTGRVWIEVKLLILLLLPKLFFFPGVGGTVYDVIDRLGFRYILEIFNVLNMPLALVLLYLIINDLRLNRGQFRRGMCAYFKKVLSAAEEKYTIRARLTRRTWAALICITPFAVCGSLFGAFVVINAWHSSEQYRVFLLLIPIAVVVLLALLLWLFLRFLATARDIGALAEQITAIRAGDLKSDAALPKDADLVDLSAALSDIRAGMDAALTEQLRSERMRVELIANVSHDLKTPLTSVISYTELLSREEDLPDHVKDYIRILSDKAERLKTMVQDVFEVSKAASGELNVRLTRLDLGKLLRQTLADMSDPIAESGLLFRTEIPEAPVFINADGDRLYRVFQNLIQNALQYSLDGSRVYVYLRAEEGLARAGVKNTSRAELPAGTDFTARFVRGDASRTGEGSGLGLAIASSFTASCGGAFTVETDADLFSAEVSFPVG